MKGYADGHGVKTFAALGFSETNSDFTLAFGERPRKAGNHMGLERLIVGEIDYEAEACLGQFLAELLSSSFGRG